jgi:tetratricopeptide (TPR) repeat protein
MFPQMVWRGRLAAIARPLLTFALSAATASVGAGCRRAHDPPPVRETVSPPSSIQVMPRPSPAREVSDIRALRRCFPEIPTWSDPQVLDLLDRATAYQEEDDFDGVLACAEEAARQAPRSVEAHHNRALAFMRLGRFDEARDALALALALAPDDAECLELAAELFINRLPPSAERTAIGLEYARRGRARTTGARNRGRSARLSLLEGQALVDLGRSAEALEPLEHALRLNPGDVSARYEQGVAQFELCRFPTARKAFEVVLEKDEKHAHALYHLALILEREGREDEADKLFAQASERDPRSFPPTPQVNAEAFDLRVRAALDRLPPDVRQDLATVPIETAELPAPEDLTAERPPLSPTILGLFRGLPLGRQAASDEAVRAPGARSTRGRQARQANVSGPPEGPGTGAVPARAIVLYRRNILRSIHGAEDLDRAIERTLLHEVGHLRGEDDGSLRDRGLE